MWPSKNFDSKTISSIPAGVDSIKEFTMTNVQQLNLIGFYYHGYVSMHIISSQSFQINFSCTVKCHGFGWHLAVVQSFLYETRASVLSLHFGFKNYLLITSVIGAVLTLGFPMMIRQRYTLGIISRILLGCMHSGWFPGLI